MESFGRSSFGFSVKWTCVLAIVLSLALTFLGRVGYIAGLWVGVLWLGLKAWLMHRMMASVANPDPKPDDRKKLFALAFVKFPVLYLAGFFLLLTDWIRLEGVFCAFTLFFAVAAAGWIFRQSAKPKVKA